MKSTVNENKSTELCYNIEEPQKHKTNQKKPDSGDHVFIIQSVYKKYPGKSNYIETERSFFRLGMDWEVKTCMCMGFL
jgi:transcription antitermination factor NusG